MALRFSVSLLFSLSWITLVNSVPIALPVPLSPAIQVSAPADIAMRHADPLPTFPNIANNVANSVSGNGGAAAGGSVTSPLPFAEGAGLLGLANLHLVSLGSHNAGNAGTANSVSAISPSNAHVLVKGPTAINTIKSSKMKLVSPNTSNALGNANSGVGGNADGGSTFSTGSAVDLFSDNGGNGGNANSEAGGAVPVYRHPRSIAFHKHAISRKSRLSRMAHPYR